MRAIERAGLNVGVLAAMGSLCQSSARLAGFRLDEEPRVCRGVDLASLDSIEMAFGEERRENRHEAAGTEDRDRRICDARVRVGYLLASDFGRFGAPKLESSLKLQGLNAVRATERSARSMVGFGMWLDVLDGPVHVVAFGPIVNRWGRTRRTAKRPSTMQGTEPASRSAIEQSIRRQHVTN